MPVPATAGSSLKSSVSHSILHACRLLTARTTTSKSRIPWLNSESLPELQTHPKLGASLEGLALEHVLRILRAEPGEAFYWSTHGGTEVDLMLVRGGQRWGFEFKYGDAPRTTKSMRVAIDDLKLQRFFVIYPGEKDYALDDAIEVLPLNAVEKLVG